MFSGKTEELLRRLKRAEIAKLKVEIFKPRTDTRYDEHAVVSHDLNSVQSTPVETSSAILLLNADTQVVGIDEAQFFDDGLPEVCNRLAEKGIRVIVAGLDMDFQGRPFGPIPALMAIAELVTKVNSVCAVEVQRCILSGPQPVKLGYCLAKRTAMNPVADLAFISRTRHSGNSYIVCP